jgi:hypothetical protein
MAALQLHAVTPGQGLLWVRSAFQLFFRRPFAFTGLFVMFMLAMLIATTLPWIGGALALATMPLLSLGFMLAARSALEGGPVHPGQFIEPLRGARRRPLLLLCGVHAAAGVLVIVLWNTLLGEPVQRFWELVAAGNASQEDLANAYFEESLQWSLAALTLLWGLLISAPFWYAAALVHWGGQSVAQAVFSSTVALWRTKGAFALYLLGWVGVSLLFSLMSGVVLGLLGMREAAAAAALPAMLMFSTAFYVSLYFGFTDTFGAPDGADVSTL